MTANVDRAQPLVIEEFFVSRTGISEFRELWPRKFPGK
jgi:hypothetical protein